MLDGKIDNRIPLREPLSGRGGRFFSVRLGPHSRLE